MRRIHLGQDSAVAEEQSTPTAFEMARSPGLVAAGILGAVLIHFTYNVVMLVTANAVYDKCFKTKG